MKKFYEAPVAEVTVLESKDNILSSEQDLEIGVGGLFGPQAQLTVDVAEEI